MQDFDFTTYPLKKLLWKLALPMMVAFLVQALYNTVDAIFVGQYAGNQGVAALGVVFPLQLMLGTISVLFAAGGASLISIALGQNKVHKANEIVTVQFILGITFTALATILSYIYLEPIMVFFGAAHPQVLLYTKEYMNIVLAGTVLVAFSTLLSFMLRSQGLAKQSMMLMIVGAVTNIVLDPILVFGFNMGIAGAAYATVVAQLVSALFALYYMVFLKQTIHLTKIHPMQLWYSGKKITMLGLSSFLGTTMFSVVLVVSNRVLVTHGNEVDIALFATIIKISQLLILPIFGLVSGMQPIVGFNYGAGHNDRVKEVFRLALKYVFIFMFTGSILIVLFPQQVMRVFTSDALPDYLPVRLSFIGFVGSGIVIACFNYLQSLNLKFQALVLSLLRQVILYIPMVLILSPLLGTYAVWIALPAADIIAMFIAYFFTLYSEKKLLDTK